MAQSTVQTNLTPMHAPSQAEQKAPSASRSSPMGKQYRGLMRTKATGLPHLFRHSDRRPNDSWLSARPRDHDPAAATDAKGLCHSVRHHPGQFTFSLAWTHDRLQRHFEPLAMLKRNIDAMNAVKLNVFHWHLTED